MPNQWTLYLYVLIRRVTSRLRGQIRLQSFPSRFSQQTTVLSVPRCVSLSVIALILVSTVVDRVLNRTQIVKGCKVKLSVVPPNTTSKNEDPSAEAATVSISSPHVACPPVLNPPHAPLGQVWHIVAFNHTWPAGIKISLNRRQIDLISGGRHTQQEFGQGGLTPFKAQRRKFWHPI